MKRGMKMLENLLDRFGSEEIELDSIDRAAEVFVMNREDHLHEVEQRSINFEEKAEELANDLREEIETLEEFEDEEGRKVVDDVVGNIVDERLDLMSGFEAVNDPEELYARLDELIEDFRSMSRKEAAVAEEAQLKQRLSEFLGDMEGLRDDIAEFLDTDFSTVKRYREVRETLDRREEVGEELEEIEEQLQKKELRSLQNDLEEKQEKLEDLNHGELATEYDSLAEKLEELKRERDQKMKSISRAVSRMERGLKKLLYEGGIGASSAEYDILKLLRRREVSGLLDRDPELVSGAMQKVLEAGKEGLDESTSEKLEESAEELSDAEELFDEIDQLDSEIDKLEEELEEHRFLAERKEVERDISSLENRIEEIEEKRNRLERRIGELRDEKESLEEGLIDVMESEFDEVNIK